MFPVWLGFRGGKGVATGLGSFLLLTPKAILLAIGIFLALTAAFRFVSLASITAAASLPLLAVLLGEAHGPAEVALIAAASLMIIVKHQQNIRRLLNGAEPKFQIRPK
jgi:glycerol-3-phosphate acyltransferase PlsY